MPETRGYESGRLGHLTGVLIVGRFGFRRGYVPDGSKQAFVVVPVLPVERGQLHGFQVRPALSFDDLGLEQADD